MMFPLLRDQVGRQPNEWHSSPPFASTAGEREQECPMEDAID